MVGPISLNCGGQKGFSAPMWGHPLLRDLKPQSVSISQLPYPEHEPIVAPHGVPEYDELKVFKRLSTIIGNVKNAIHGRYHTAREKHLPRYLAEFCYRFNRHFQLGDIITRFTYVALPLPLPQYLLKLAEIQW